MTHQKKPRKKLNTLVLLDEAQDIMALDRAFDEQDYSDYDDLFVEESFSPKQASLMWS